MGLKIIVVDPQKLRQANVKDTADFLMKFKAGIPEIRAREAAALLEPLPAVGSKFSGANGFECPIGLPNCRNCGDPAFKDSCSAAGHCPQCGTAHGVAPDSVIAAKGLKIEID